MPHRLAILDCPLKTIALQSALILTQGGLPRQRLGSKAHSRGLLFFKVVRAMHQLGSNLDTVDGVWGNDGPTLQQGGGQSEGEGLVSQSPWPSDEGKVV